MGMGDWFNDITYTIEPDGSASPVDPVYTSARFKLTHVSLMPDGSLELGGFVSPSAPARPGPCPDPGVLLPDVLGRYDEKLVAELQSAMLPRGRT